ncbi:hypothetical protein CC78DRAFT_542897 [Lojkania enalia]|uniref:Uncharacterized protein n=1 Tax=Lojkania enalia TaxID=147567 RepID=A0A9P4KAZ4_9PLEO|nr:hypothetical protein CC78DRAFT_542897 [Didymosphaeria enalia]
MHFTVSILLALPILVSATLSPAKRYLTLRQEEDDLHLVCSIDGKEPKDCGMGYCCYYNEECKPADDDQAIPYCEGSSDGIPVSMPALQFATTIPFTGASASPTSTSSPNSPSEEKEPTASAESTGVAMGGYQQAGGALGVGLISLLAGLMV